MKLEKACVPLGFVWASPLEQWQEPLPKAPVPAQTALEEAGLKTEDVDAIKMHNPFSINDAGLSRQSGVPAEEMNDHGCSLIYGHPQGLTGARLIGANQAAQASRRRRRAVYGLRCGRYRSGAGVAVRD